MSQLSVICHINKYTLRCTLSTGVLNVRSQYRDSLSQLKNQGYAGLGSVGLEGREWGCWWHLVRIQEAGSGGKGTFGLLGRGLAEADFFGCFHVRLGNQKSHLLASMSDQIYCPEIKERGREVQKSQQQALVAASPSPG